MNAWDYHLLGKLLLILIFIFPWILALLVFRTYLKEYYWYNHPIFWLKSILIGNLYAVRINNVWSLCRGKLKDGGLTLRIKYGKDKHIWNLGRYNFELLDSQEYKKAEQYIIERNVSDLKRQNPDKNDFCIKPTKNVWYNDPWLRTDNENNEDILGAEEELRFGNYYNQSEENL